MSNNIDLGTFQWDTNKIEHQIAANNTEMNKFSATVKAAKDQIKEQSKEISELEKRIESERKAQERMRGELEKGYRSQESYNAEIAKSNQVLDGMVAEQIALGKAQADALIIQNKSQQSTKDLRLENNELNKLLGAGRTELSQNESAYRDLNKELNALKTEAKNLGAQMIILERDGKQGTDEYKRLAAQFVETSKKADDLNNDFKALDHSVGDNQRTVGDYKDQIKSAASEITIGLNQIANGDVVEGLKSIQTGIGGVTVNLKALWVTMLTNPLTALLVGFTALATGIAFGVKEIFDYNESIKENAILVENLTGTTGKLADDIRLTANALSKAFGDDFNEVVKTANVLAKQLGISYEEAFDKIQEGYVRGANANGDFLERLSEYSPLLKKYGFDINEIIALQVQAQQQGIFNDKFEDSLKEAGLSLEEFTKSQSDALTSAFGKDFSDKISQGVNSGALSVKDALLLMGTEAKKQGLSVQQWGILTADVFKGAGEDAGGAKKVIDNVYEALVKSGEPYTELQKKTDQYADAMRNLEVAKDKALKSNTILNFSKDLDILWVNAQIVWYGIVDAVIEAIKWIDDITGSSEVLGETWDEVVNYAKSLWDAVQGIVDVFNDLFDALGLNNDETKSITKSFFKMINPLNLLKFGFQLLSTAIKAFSSFIESNRINITAFALTVKSVFAQIMSAAMSFKNLDFTEGLEKLKNISISKEFANARKEAEKIVALNKNISNKKIVKNTEKETNSGKTQTEKDAAEEAKRIKDAASTSTGNKSTPSNSATKNLEDEAKRAIEISKNEADKKTQTAKLELAEYIAINAEKYKDEKRLSAEKVRFQKEYFEQVKRRQQEINRLDEESKTFAIQQKIDEINAKKSLNENDKNEVSNLQSEIENIKKDFSIKDIELQNDTNQKKKEIDKNFYEQNLEDEKLSSAIDSQNKLLEIEENGNNEFEFRQEQLDAQKELDNAKNEDDKAKGLISLENYEASKNLIERKYAKSSKEITEDVESSRLSTVSNTFGQVASLLGKNTAAGKAAGIAQATINTYQGVTEVWKTRSSLSEPFATISKVISTGVVLASGLGAVRKITAVGVPKAAKGMLISGNSHANGGVNISTPNGTIEAEGGEPILTKKAFQMFPGLISDINVAGGGIPLYAGGGLVPSRLSTVQNSIKVNTGSMTISDEAIQSIAIAIYSGSQSGISDLAENRKIANGANF